MENKKTAEKPGVPKAEETAPKAAAAPAEDKKPQDVNAAQAQDARTETASVQHEEKSDADKTKDSPKAAAENGSTVKPGEASVKDAKEKADGDKAEGKAPEKEEAPKNSPEKADEPKSENGTQDAGKKDDTADSAEAGAKAAEEKSDGQSGSTAEITGNNSIKGQEGTETKAEEKAGAAEGAAKAETKPENSEETTDKPAEAPAEADKKPEKEKPNIVLSVLGIILCVILVPILVLNIVLIVQGFTQDASVMPNIAGKFPLMVQSGSMSPTIEVGDLIIVTAPEKGQKFGVDDVVTFWDGAPGGPLVTHRIVEVTTDDDGKTAYRTKGDANSAQDGTLVYAEDIVGTYYCRIPFLGDVAMFMQTIPGLIVCVVLPLALFIVYDVIRRRKLSKSEQEETAALMAELEKLRAEKNNNNE
jgi:signal peptidase